MCDLESVQPSCGNQPVIVAAYELYLAWFIMMCPISELLEQNSRFNV